jgi:hypothetical protein
MRITVSGRMEYHDEKGNIVKCSADSLIKTVESDSREVCFRVCDFQVRTCVVIRSCINRALNDSRVKCVLLPLRDPMRYKFFQGRSKRGI